MLNALELFAGIGGIALAEEIAGIRVAGLCEYAEFPRKVLRKHWPDVPLYKDVTKLDIEEIRRSGTDPGTVDLISGGFPCQPFSSAGKRRGTKDDRDLWPEMFRIIKEIRPTWVVGENVAGFTHMELDRTLANLESIEYQATAFVLPAEAVGALHSRQRTFIVAHAPSERFASMAVYEKVRRGVIDRQGDGFKAWHQTWAEQEHILTRGRRIISDRVSGVSRNDDGISEGLDRLKAVGNAVMPLQILPIFQTIVEVEEQRNA